jgi:hypothetical protein
VSGWSLLSGLIGALAVFLLGWFREWWIGERARRGLLRLLSSEIQHNAVVAETIRESGQFLISADATARMTTATWRASRGAAVSLPPALLEDLDDYYQPLEILLTLRKFPGVQEERMERFIRKILSEELGGEFVRSKDPWGDYERKMTEAQERTQGRIRDYLSCSTWWGPFVAVVWRWQSGRE